MTDLMEALFNYAQERKISALLAEQGDYYGGIACVERQEELLRAKLDQETAKCLDVLLRAQENTGWLVERACFRAGFQIAMALSRS